MVFLFLLTQFTKHNALQVHSCWHKWQDFLLLMGDQYSTMCIYIHQRTFKFPCLGYFVINTAVKRGAYSFLNQCFHFLWINTSKWNCWIIGYCVLNLRTGIQGGCTNSHSHQWCMRVPFSPHPHQDFLSLFIITILTGVR